MQNKAQMKIIHGAAYDMTKGLDLTPFLVMVDWFPPLRFIPNQTYRKFFEAIKTFNGQITEWMDSEDEQGLLRHMMTLPDDDKQKYEINSVVCQKGYRRGPTLRRHLDNISHNTCISKLSVPVTKSTKQTPC